MNTVDVYSTIETGFRMLKSHLKITDIQHSVIVACQGELEKAISKGFDTYGIILTGAYSRNTMITVKKGAVVDAYLLLKPKYGHEFSSRELVNRLPVRRRSDNRQTTRNLNYARPKHTTTSITRRC